MRDDPYPARYYVRQFDEPFNDKMAALIAIDSNDPASPFHPATARLLLFFMTLYLACALFLIFTVSSYAAPLGSGTMSLPLAVACIEAPIAAGH